MPAVVWTAVSWLVALGQLPEPPSYARRFRDGFQDGGGVTVPSEIVTLLIIFALAALVYAAVTCWRARQQGKPVDCPHRLFAELCKRHELDWPSRRLLRQLARAHELEHPARVFVDPRLFEPARLPDSLRAFQVQLAALKSRLF